MLLIRFNENVVRKERTKFCDVMACVQKIAFEFRVLLLTKNPSPYSRMKASASDNQDEQTSRRKRRSSGSGQFNEVPAVVMSLSDACSNHKKSHEPVKSMIETQSDSKEAKSNIPPKCVEDLNNLRDILYQVDKYYTNVLCSEGQRGTKAKKITASDVSNLCVFYGAMLSGSFCPHSLFLLDYGRDVQQILCRVNNLIQFFTWDCIIQDTLSHLKRTYSRTNNANSPKSNVTSCVSDQMAFTAAAFLNTVLPQHTIDVILIDLVTVLYDLGIVGSLGVPITATDKSSKIEVNVFSETSCLIHPDSGSSPLFIHVPNHQALLSLQCGIARIIFILLVLRYTKTTLGQDIDHFSVGCVGGEERFLSYNSSWLLDLLNSNGDFRATFLTTFRQIITHQPFSSYSLSPLDISWDLLSLNVKLTASNLLTLLLPDFSKCAERTKFSTSIWSDLSELIASSIHSHLIRVRDLYEKSIREKIPADVESMCSHLSVQLSILLRDTMIVPTYPYKPRSMDMLHIRNRAIRFLWNSLTVVKEVVTKPQQIALCKMLFRAIHCSLNLPLSSTTEVCLSLSLVRVRNQARAYFISQGLLPYLLSLIKTEVGGIAVSILVDLLSDMNNDESVSDSAEQDNRKQWKRSRVEWADYSSSIKLDTPALDAIFPLPSLEKFFRSAFLHADYFTNAVKSTTFSGDADYAKVLDLIGALEIAESLESTIRRHILLEKFYIALKNVIILHESSKNPFDATADISKIISRLVSYGLRSSFDFNLVQLGDGRHNKASLLQSLSEFLLKYLNDGTRNFLQTDNLFGGRPRREFEPFDSAVISMLSQRHKQSIIGYVNSHQLSCQSRCSRIYGKVGFSDPLQGQRSLFVDCLCALNSDYDCFSGSPRCIISVAPSRFHQALHMFLVEHTIPLPHRSVIMILELKRNFAGMDAARQLPCFELHKWLCSQSYLVPMYLEILPLQLLKSQASAEADLDRSIFLGFVQFVQFVQTVDNLDFIALFRDSCLSRDSVLCAHSLDCLSALLQWYTLLLTCSSPLIKDDVFSAWISSHPSLLRSLRFPVLIQFLSDLSPDYLFLNLVKRQQDTREVCASANVINFVLEVFRSISSNPDYFQCPQVRHALWKFIWSCSLIITSDVSRTLASTILYSPDKVPMPCFDWLVWTALHDESLTVRNYGARRVGYLIALNSFSLLRLLSNENADDDKVGRHFLAKCDTWIKEQCHLHSSSHEKQINLSKNDYLSYRAFHDMNISYSTFSNQMALVMFFSSICQVIQADSEIGILLLTETVRRIIRLYLLQHESKAYRTNESLEIHKVRCQDIVSSIAFEELQFLGDTCQLWNKLMERCEDIFTPILFHEFLSPKNDRDKRPCEWLNMNLSQFIQIFLLKSSLKSGVFGHQDELERCDGTLFFTDEALPAVISNAVSNAQYDYLLACTGFRSSLARFMTASEKKRGRHFTSEYIIGMVFRHESYRKRLMHSLSTKELKRQTAILCVTDRDGLRILGRLLPSLLLETSLQPLYFFINTVLQSEVSLRDLFVTNEIKIIIGIIWEMGCLEKEFDPEENLLNIDVQSLWLDQRFDNRAVRALKRGAIIFRNKDGNPQQCLNTVAAMESSNEYFSLEAIEATEAWVRSHFMMLLVNVDNTKWKGGRIATKIQALKCLKVLLRFLLPEDTSRFMTQVLTMIDAAMLTKCSKSDRDRRYAGNEKGGSEALPIMETLRSYVTDPPFASSRLRLLGVSSLSRVIYLALSHQVKMVGDALCKIVAILFPLLSNNYQEEEERKSDSQVDPYHKRATLEAVTMIESLLHGDRGSQLAPYFQYVPFLPTHPLLQEFRSSLKKHGIDLDSLNPHSANIESQAFIERTHDIDDFDTSSVATSTDLTATADGPKIHTNKYIALRNLFRVSEVLVKHENDNVRYFTLFHLILVLKRNRGLFYHLLDSDEFHSRSSNNPNEENSTDFINVQNVDIFQGGSLVTLTRSLLRRCTEEVNERNRLLLASCLGEIGAIDPSFFGQRNSIKVLGSDKDGTSASSALIPWKSKSMIIEFQLNLVTKHFVVALRSSPTPKDQHKIAFAIQEVLKLLDHDEHEGYDIERKKDIDKARTMSPWLLEKLVKADVVDVIKPFWSSLYKQQEPSKHRDPPFYNLQDTFFSWISSWCRYMIEQSRDNRLSPYRKIFFACRSAIRSHSGIGVIEYILPMLLLDILVFGDERSKSVVVNEMTGILRIHERTEKCKMNDIEVLKSLGCIFTLIDTLQSWSSIWIEYQSKQSSSIPESADNVIRDDNPLPANKCVNSIVQLLEDIPLSLRAKAAASAGLHARSLLLLEMEGRRYNSSDFSERINDSARSGRSDIEMKETNKLSIVKTHINDIDLALMQFVLGELNDLDSMSSLARHRDRNGLTQTYSDKLHEREYNGDFDGVIQIYEQATQIGPHSSLSSMNDSLNSSYVRALLKMGRLESAHLHVQGILTCESGLDTTNLIPCAVEASWRLCRWDLLDQLLKTITDQSPSIELRTAAFDNNISRYQMFYGKALLGIHKNDKNYVHHALEEGRNAVMSALAIASRENYSRSYPYLITLHSMTEIEDVADLYIGHNDQNVSYTFTNRVVSDNFPAWHWKARLDLTRNNTDAALPLLNVRISLSRLAAAQEVEAALWLDAGKLARKSGQVSIAIDALAHAEALHKQLIEKHTGDDVITFRRLKISANECRLQLAKIMHISGQSSIALQMLEDQIFQKLLILNPVELNKEIRTDPLKGEVEGVARRALQVTEWMIDGGFKNASEVIARYRLLQKLVPTWEKARYSFAKYLDSVLYHRANSQSKADDLKMDDDLLRMEALKVDDGSQRLLLEAVKEYAEALQLNQKHVFLCLPRLLTLWFDFTSMNGSSTLRSNQEKANAILKDCIKTIPAISYYTVLPQLVSRLNHSDEDTCAIVSAILRRVLTKFPKQAMWGLAWLRNSVHPERQLKGEEIFKAAQKNMQRCGDAKTHDLLVASKGLFMFLLNLAKYQSKSEQQSINMRSWTSEVSLDEFLPPVQEALTITRNAIGDSGTNLESFPPFVHRMRSFKSRVQVMSSKAKPKKLTAYTVPRGWSTQENAPMGGSGSDTGNMGEIHFLVKQEAKGDLRKDARVQDFNNVVNRLLATSSIRNAAGRRKRRLGDLRLKTFSVVCLSEDCGIIEWVPNTASLRNVVAESYNPQAPAESIKRRGKRISNFNDPNLRESFQKCQDLYIKNGDLSGAVKLFNEVCIKEYPPLLYWWFVQKFDDPHKWFEARSLFTLSSAVWSAIGHVIGLGDRHSENLLIDVSSGECVHVDFDCIFDKGLHLPRPEVVPFRLTPNILDAFGPIGADGAFSGSLSSVMATLRENRDLLLSVLEPFLKDPIIDWKKHRGQQNATEISNKDSSESAIEAKRSIKVIEGRLKGIYNLRNPNYKKIKRTDGQSYLTDDDDMAYIIPLSVEGQVHRMISEACSHENLVQLYVGWMAWL